ncbi:hypothetical protein AMTR_s00008p00254280 [Amborella trichopoda]|uniref:Uncharacterized protein n=1 Tax=Amborella trichopoda TaxID=13333 RepID=W1NI30_AMBTC|nr:hypothetical protein AMTR_s00008p00254280 [Amborella trichopoda]
MITEGGRTSRSGPPVQTSDFSPEAADGRSKVQSFPTLNCIPKGAGVEHLRLDLGKASTSPTISAFNTDALRDKVEERWASSLERLAKGSPTKEPPLLASIQPLEPDRIE